MRGLSWISLTRIVSSAPSRLPYTSSLVKRRISNPSAASAAERAASRAISSSVECVAPSPDRSPGVDDHPGVKAGEVGDEASENDLAAEPEAGDLLPSEALPKPALGAGRVAAQGAGERRQ